MMQKLLQNNMKEGDLINYLQTDTESMASFFLQITKILIFPFQFVTYFYILYKIFGKAFYVGLSTFILFAIISFASLKFKECFELKLFFVFVSVLNLELKFIIFVLVVFVVLI